MINKILVITFLISINVAYTATWKTINGSASGGGAISCPANFIAVPKLSGYTYRDFCVAKYEMKNDGYGTAVSQASGTPWVSIASPASRTACLALGVGYDLLSNDQWQTIARNISGVGSNWSTGTVASGELNRGHTDNAPASGLAAVTDDNDPCNGTGQTCTGATFDAQKRTNTLSNGNIIWDFGGNVSEWLTNSNTAVNGTNDFASNLSGGDIRQTKYGPVTSTICAAPGSSPYCGMGYVYSNYSAGAVLRGGNYAATTNAGIFFTDLTNSTAAPHAQRGFRCVFVP